MNLKGSRNYTSKTKFLEVKEYDILRKLKKSSRWLELRETWQ
jgi:hypothetical protein